MVKLTSAESKKKRLPPAPLGGISKPKREVHPLIETRKKVYAPGRDVLPKAYDLSRYVRWPLYIRLQRQRRVLYRRFKVPPAINQFNCAIDKDQARALLRLLNKYKPESKVDKKARLLAEAAAVVKEESAAQRKSVKGKKLCMLKFGINHVTDLVELRQAKLVVIAHDVDPIELVVWLPALCRKKDIPYCIIKGKARLGKLVHQKTSCAVVVDNIRKEDQTEFDNLCRNFRAQYNENLELRRQWGGGVLGIKARHKILKAERAAAIEHAKKLGIKT